MSLVASCNRHQRWVLFLWTSKLERRLLRIAKAVVVAVWSQINLQHWHTSLTIIVRHIPGVLLVKWQETRKRRKKCGDVDCGSGNGRVGAERIVSRFTSSHSYLNFQLFSRRFRKFSRGVFARLYTDSKRFGDKWGLLSVSSQGNCNKALPPMMLLIIDVSVIIS